MTFKELYEREKYVVVHGQTSRFRIIKYLIIIPVLVAVYFWKGPVFFRITLLVLFVVSLFIHFLFRYKTKAWTEPWGPYKPIIKK